MSAAPGESTRLLPFNAMQQQQEQQQHNPAAHHRRQQEEEEAKVDPVERMVKHAVTVAAAFLLLDFLGVLALVLKGLGFDRLPGLARLPPALHSYWAVFAPFWLADLVVLLLAAEVFYGICTLRATTRDEKRNMARCVLVT